jgi:hypothetical protein
MGRNAAVKEAGAHGAPYEFRLKNGDRDLWTKE